jgi:hypothetical protein
VAPLFLSVIRFQDAIGGFMSEPSPDNPNAFFSSSLWLVMSDERA